MQEMESGGARAWLMEVFVAVWRAVVVGHQAVVAGYNAVVAGLGLATAWFVGRTMSAVRRKEESVWRERIVDVSYRKTGIRSVMASQDDGQVKYDR
jgi:hypothetical protein